MRPLTSLQIYQAISILVFLVMIVSLTGLSCTTANTDQSQKTPDSQQQSPGNASSNVAPTPPSPPPPVIPTPPPATQPPVQPAPAIPAVSYPDSTALITVQASQMVLAIDDLGTGWVKGIAVSPAISKATSYSHVYFSKGSAFPPVIQNTVAVYRSIEIAGNVYEQEKPANVSLTNPNIGNECFFNNTVPLDKKLVFRRNNVVVWIWLQNDKSGDIESYARIVDKKIAASLIPSIPVPASSPPSQPSPPVPATPVTPAVTGVVNKQAYQMVLDLSDMGSGWNKGNASPSVKQQASSTCHVYYSKGTAYAPGVQNSTAVYRTVELAKSVFEKEKPSGTKLSFPGIGDECFLNDSVALDKKLVFRKDNVIVWIWVQQYIEGDIEGYARIVEQKIRR